MRVILSCIMLLCLSVLQQAKAQHWIQSGGGLTIDESRDVTVDNSGNIFVVGYFTGSSTWGSSTLTSAGSSDIYVVKYNSSGTFQWAVAAGGTGADRAEAVTSDASGNVYVTGSFNGSASFGATTITSAGSQDVFIAKYSATGALQWVEKAGGTSADIVRDIDLYDTNLVITGEFQGTSTFGSSSLTAATGTSDIFIAKMGTSGAFLWAQIGTGSQDNGGVACGFDNSGNIYATGSFSSNITFDQSHTNSMFNAIYLVKFNASGVEQDFNIIGGATSNTVTDLQVDNNGNAYLVGNFDGSLTFFGSPNTSLTNTYDNGIFVAKYDNNGDVDWVSEESSDNAVQVNALALQGSNLFFGGFFECQFSSAADDLNATGLMRSVGYKDLFVYRYTTSGGYGYVKQVGGHEDDVLHGLSATSTGLPIVSASFEGEVFIPTSSSFSSNTLNSYSCNSSYCSDSDYGDFSGLTSAGNLDVVLGPIFDPSRSPLDFYTRSGAGCSQDSLIVCINGTCPDSVEACVGTILTASPFTCSDIAPKWRYSWDGGPYSVTDSYNATSTQWVTLKRKSLDGCYNDIDSIHTTINPGPAIPPITDDRGFNSQSIPYNMIELCDPDTVTITANGVTASNYYWSSAVLPSNVQDSTLSTYTEGAYFFVVEDSTGCKDSSSVFVDLFAPLPPFDLEIVDTDTQQVCDGDQFLVLAYDSILNPGALTLCFPSSDYTISSNWSITGPGGPSVNVNCHSYGYVNVDTTGLYTLSVEIIRTTPCEADTFNVVDSFYVLFDTVPTIGQFAITIQGSPYYCPNDSTTLTATGGANYAWFGPGLPATSDSVVTVWQTGLYTVQALVSDTTPAGCYASFATSTDIYVQIKPQPEVTASHLIICPGDSVLLTATGGDAYLWQGPSGTLSSVADTVWATEAGEYFCQVNDADSCNLLSNSVFITQYATPQLLANGDINLCEGDSVTISVVASDSSDIEWLAPLSGSGLTQVIHDPGTYTCKITSCGIETFATIEVFGALATAEISGDTVFCAGDQTTLTANSGMASYQWSNGSTDTSIIVDAPGMYLLSTIDSNGCVSENDTFYVNESDPQVLLTSDSGLVLCPGDTFILNATAGFSQYVWSHSNDTDSIAYASYAGTYQVSVSDTYGCNDQDLITLSMQPDSSDISLLGENHICEGDTVILEILRNDFEVVQWMPTNDSTKQIEVSETGWYSAMAIDTFGCLSATDSLYILVEPNDLEQPVTSDTTICEGSSIDLFASAPSGDLLWYDSNGVNLIEVGPQLTTPSLYSTTKYVVYSQKSVCWSDPAEALVEVVDCYTIDAPNVFSPNGDGINDFFRVNIPETTCFRCLIYNRWGELVYTMDNINLTWDGTHYSTGEDVSDGTYFFIVELCRFDGSQGTATGYVTVLRD